MKKIKLKSFAKINLSLDVCGLLENGYHEVSMIMQQILLCDDVDVKWTPSDTSDGIQIRLSTNKYFLPTDERNLAYKAALLMVEKYGQNLSGEIYININKRGINRINGTFKEQEDKGEEFLDDKHAFSSDLDVLISKMRKDGV